MKDKLRQTVYSILLIFDKLLISNYDRLMMTAFIPQAYIDMTAISRFMSDFQVDYGQ